MDSICDYASRPVAFFFRYVRRRPLAHAVILLAVLAAVACSVSTQYGVKFLVDVLSTRDRAGQAWLAVGILMGLIAADNLFWRIAGWLAHGTFTGVTADLRDELFGHLTGHAPSYFADRLPGTLASRVTATANAVFTVENMFIWNVLPPCAATAGAIAYLFAISMPMALGMVGCAGLLTFALFRLAAAGERLHLDFADKAAAVDGEMVDVIGNMPLVRAFGAINREHHRFNKTIARETAARRRSLFYLEKLRTLHATITILLTFGLLGWSVLLWQRGAASNGDVVLVCTLGFTILHATRDLAVALVDATQHMARLSEALATLLLPHQIEDHPEAVPLVTRNPSIAFEGVDFRFPGGDPVLSDFWLSIKAGQRVGLVGRSGAGKSTLLALLQRFYDLEGGRIAIDGADIALVTQHSLGELITVVPQDISLFHRSIMQNIRYSRPGATDQAVIEAAQAALCHDFIEALPEGYGTIVGERGVKLSGGQRQRLAIARAFLKDAPILLLDEATSALDSESEVAIRSALDRLMRGRTVIAVAHRLSTLRGFDRIVVLQEGRIIEDGSPDQLMRRNGLYHELVHREVTRLAAVS